MLVCSPGGHLQQMLALEPAWGGHVPIWVTLDGPDTRSLLAGEDVVYGYGPTNRSLRNLVRNLRVAWCCIRDHRPHAVLSTGAGLAVPFFLVGRLLGRRLVYVESVTRTRTISLSGRLVYLLADGFFVQWPAPAASRRRARYEGSVLWSS